MKGCGSPAQFKMNIVEGGCYPANADLQICISMKTREPTYDHCQKSAINSKLVKFKAPGKANNFQEKDIIYFSLQSQTGC